MKDELILLLKDEFGYPVRLQGSLAPNEKYPDSFFTFWNTDTPEWDHYDNDPIGYLWEFDINFYSTDPGLVNTVLEMAKELLQNNGWLVPGLGYDVTSDEPTHTGRGIHAIYNTHVRRK